MSQEILTRNPSVSLYKSKQTNNLSPWTSSLSPLVLVGSVFGGVGAAEQPAPVGRAPGDTASGFFPVTTISQGWNNVYVKTGSRIEYDLFNGGTGSDLRWWSRLSITWQYHPTGGIQVTNAKQRYWFVVERRWFEVFLLIDPGSVRVIL